MNLVPYPKNLTITGGNVTLPSIVLAAEPLLPAAHTLIESAKKLLSLTLTLTESADASPAIHFQHAPEMAKDAYRLEIANEQVRITAPDIPSACHAVASLLQLLVSGNDLPALLLSDAPDCTWSSMMVDLARRYHPFPTLLRYLDLCFLLKIRVLHLHFTDEQGYRLPSRAYPLLCAEDGCYTEEEIRVLTEYAHRRGVLLMPEIDVPGHCGPFCRKYPEIFGNGPLIKLNETALHALRTLIAEICDLFPYSTYLHIGGDEAAIGAWNDMPDCVAYAASVIEGFDPAIPDRRLASEQMLARFISEMADAVWANGRQPIAWEGFAAFVNHLVNKNLILYSWENYYQLTTDLLNAGFRIINGSWNPNYIVTPSAMWPREEVFEWSIHRFKAVHPYSPYRDKLLVVEDSDLLLGGGMLAWGDSLWKYPDNEAAAKAEWDEVVRRLPLVAEHTWDHARHYTLAQFDEAAANLNCLLARLENE